ncbi:hypothetical protein CFK38_02680 [Brachybacterium vulturis]|uniref:YCII-related domain-containing protein n=1 Tax=Brachybacterium vulturis TaxID=2017484 RepID=A0A291GKH7_9MICO|nr:YciI family protein [Brachybacterium vulturis]ATG50546.1 hypothetical protein CFK38_02680 [Brachybacterium vulturis]
MAKYVLLKHYRGAPAGVNDVPMEQWSERDVADHLQYMEDFAERLRESGEFVDSLALSDRGTFVRYDGVGRPPLTDSAALDAKDLVAGWMIIDVADHDRALELAAELSAEPGKDGEPIHEWLELRPVLG